MCNARLVFPPMMNNSDLPPMPTTADSTMDREETAVSTIMTGVCVCVCVCVCVEERASVCEGCLLMVA